MDDILVDLAGLIHRRNQVDEEITLVIGRPAIIGHIGEFIASIVFDIELHSSAVYKGDDGYFRSGELRGRSVNIKFYGKQEGILDIREDALPDYFLVLTGPRSSAMTSKGKSRPISIDHVYLFETTNLLTYLRSSGKKIGIATGLQNQLWHEAEIYPVIEGRYLTISDEQRKQLALFNG